jgi:hypothetical protein
VNQCFPNGKLLNGNGLLVAECAHHQSGELAARVGGATARLP